MEKKILVAVDHSLQAMQAIDYVALMDRAIIASHFVLFHVQPALSQYLTDEAQRKQKARKVLEKTMAANDAKAREILETHEPDPLPDSVLETIRSIVEGAEEELGVGK